MNRMEMRITKEERLKRVEKAILQDPFLTDRELAKEFSVSIQTIRLHRLELGISEVRERIRELAQQAYSKVKSVDIHDITGQLIDVDLNHRGTSILETTQEMTPERGQIIRGHYLFAQANSLAVAIIDADIVLTGAAKIRFRRPVFVDERLIAKAMVNTRRDNKFFVEIIISREDSRVFEGNFTMVALGRGEGGEII